MMKIKFNDFQKYSQAHEADFSAAFRRVFHSGWYILGEEVELFEQEFAQYLQVKHCVGVANGLEALQISLLALGIGPGDEVITTPISAFATTLAIHAVGATPIFVDTTTEGQINCDLIPAVITSKTKAVIPVHLYGNPVDLTSLIRICNRHNLFLIEDAAQAHGSKYRQKKLGTQGVLNCFSFYPTKNLGALGDGGAIVTNSSRLATICKNLRDYGQRKKYIHTAFGLNSRLDELQAGFLRARLSYLDDENQKRLEMGMLYQTLLKDCLDITFLSPMEGGNCHLCVIQVANRNKLQGYLKNEGVETVVHYPFIIPDQPVYDSMFSTHPLPIARRICSEVLSLPCYPTISEKSVRYVSKKILEFYTS